MSKLLTEPRGKMELTDVKKKKRVKKEPSEPVEVRYTVLKEGDKHRVDELFRIYKENPYYARVKFFNAKEKVWFYPARKKRKKSIVLVWPHCTLA